MYITVTSAGAGRTVRSRPPVVSYFGNSSEERNMAKKAKKKGKKKAGKKKAKK